MKPILPLLIAALSWSAPAQNPPTPPGQIPPPGQREAPRGTQQLAPVPMPGARPIPIPQLETGVAPMLSLENALSRARLYGQQFVTADTAARLAHEDVVQARAALFPTVNQFNQFIYTQPNGTPSGIFVSNDGPHVYNQQAIVHGDIFAPAKIADYRRLQAAEAVARARAEVAVRGLAAVVVQNYYGVLTAQRKMANAQQTLDEAQRFLDIAQKQEQGGEVARADVVKAQIQLEQRRADLQNAEVDLQRSRANLGVFLFPTYGQAYNLVDDMETTTALPTFDEARQLASRNNPEIRAAEATVQQQNYEVRASRAGFYPTLSFDYFYGINANQYAIHNPEGMNLLGSVAQAQLTIPVWTWGAARSRVRQAEIRQRQAQFDLSFTQRQLLANLAAYYAEANTAAAQIATLRRSVDLAAESLRLTVLRYQAGEGTVFEVADAQNTLATARNALADGLARYRLALANLQTLTGAF